jgi:large subunit ribosomal protein L34
LSRSKNPRKLADGIGSFRVTESERTAASSQSNRSPFQYFAMHYPHKSSNIKRARKIGFRARMKTKKGRQMLNRKRRVGRKVQVV